jgi:hypothetical protein
MAARLSDTRKTTAKNCSDAEKVMKAPRKGTMKWLPFMSTFILEKMCLLIKTDIRSDKGFKEVHLTAVAKALLEHYCADVLSNQVYNHLTKWRLRWLAVTRLHDLSGAQWCEDGNCILLEVEYCNIPGCEARNRENTEVCIAFMHRKSGEFLHI